MSDTSRDALKEGMLVSIKAILTQRLIKKKKNLLNYMRADKGSSCSAPQGKFIFRVGVGKNGSLQKLVSVNPLWPQHYLGDPKILEETVRKSEHNFISETLEGSKFNRILTDFIYIMKK